MPTRTLTIVFLLVFINAFSQSDGESRILVRGLIKDSVDHPVSYAHILEKHRNEGWVSDYYGTFRASVLPGDTLTVTAVSFHTSYIVIPGQLTGDEFLVEIIMQNQAVELKEVVVTPWPVTFERLREEFLEVHVKDPVADLDLNLFKPGELTNIAYPKGGIRTQGPITQFYNQFSREARSKKIYAELIRKEEASKRYNKALVTKITGIKDDDEIKKFMEFCALQVRFILESSEYELYAAIWGCYNDYCERGYYSDPRIGK